jgi:hypothetical protein
MRQKMSVAISAVVMALVGTQIQAGGIQSMMGGQSSDILVGAGSVTQINAND